MTRRLHTAEVSLIAVFAFANLGHTDVLHLKSGGRLEGELLIETPTTLTIDVGVGRVSVRRASVARVERGESPLSVYRSRLALVGPQDVAAFADLARFADDHGLRRESRLLWARVASLDPKNAEAHLALGHVLAEGGYVDEAEAYRSRGFVFFDGRWMTPIEQASLLRQREQRDANTRRNDEARRAARAAEDRALRAEAVAAQARSEATRSVSFPIWGYASPVTFRSPRHGYASGCYGAACSVQRRLPPVHPPTPVATPRPRPVPVRPSSIR